MVYPISRIKALEKDLPKENVDKSLKNHYWEKVNQNSVFTN